MMDQSSARQISNHTIPSSDDAAIDIVCDRDLFDQIARLFDTVPGTDNTPDVRFTRKDDGSIVSEIEHALEQAIGPMLERLTPWAGIVGEEGYRYTPDSPYCWYIDPIDGTISFRAGMDSFSLVLTLIRDDVPLAMMAYFPRRSQMMFTAFKGRGAFCNQRRLCLQPVEFSKHPVIAVSDDYTALLAGHDRQELLEYMRATFRDVATSDEGCVVRTITDMFAYCAVAQGHVAANFELAAASWDAAPGTLLIKEAGGEALFIPVDHAVEDLAGTNIVGAPGVIDWLSARLPKLAEWRSKMETGRTA